MAEFGAGADGHVECRAGRGSCDRYGGNNEELGEKVAVTFEHREGNVLGRGADGDGSVQRFAELAGGA